MQTTSKQNILEYYLANVDRIGAGFPAAFNAPRRDHIETFNLLGFPSTAQEQYRHRDIAPLFESDWEFVAGDIPGDAPSCDSGVSDAHRILLTNGRCATELGLRQTPEGAIYGSLRSASQKMVDVVLRYYGHIADSRHNAMTALNSALVEDGAFVYIPDNVTVEKPFVITNYLHTGHRNMVCNPRLLIVLGNGAKACVVTDHVGGADGDLLVNCVREIALGNGADLELSEMGRLGGNSSLLLDSYTVQQEHSRFGYTGLLCSGDNNFVSGNVDLAGSGCECRIDTLYMVSGTQRCDVNYNVRHNSPDCHSSQLIKGIAGGRSTGAFTGRVYVAEGAQRTDAAQQSRNILLGDKSRIYTEPQLEIYADDVKCSHGATVGQMDDEAVYYMRQRGLSEAQARRLQMSGFVSDVLSRCGVEGFCTLMHSVAENRIEEL